MIELRSTPAFDRWMRRLRNNEAKARIAIRLHRLMNGNLGDTRPVGGGVSELRIHCGPGYRVYFIQRGPVVIVLLIGGDKASQQQDIETAKGLAERLEA